MKNKFTKLLFFDIEKVLLNNITRVTFYLILILFTFQILFGFIKIENFIAIIGGIIAFWYGYKKYERDKELDIIEKYGNKYAEIKNKYENNNNLDEYFNQLFNLWREEYYLHNKNYINDELWSLWKQYIIKSLNNLLITIVNTNKKHEIISKELINNDIVIIDKDFNLFIKEIFKIIYEKNLKILKTSKENHSELKKITVKNFNIFYKELDNIIIEDIFRTKKDNSSSYKALNDNQLIQIFNTTLQVNIYINNIK